jgi:hypothetical protein
MDLKRQQPHCRVSRVCAKFFWDLFYDMPTSLISLMADGRNDIHRRTWLKSCFPTYLSVYPYSLLPVMPNDVERQKFYLLGNFWPMLFIPRNATSAIGLLFSFVRRWGVSLFTALEMTFFSWLDVCFSSVITTFINCSLVVEITAWFLSTFNKDCRNDKRRCAQWLCHPKQQNSWPMSFTVTWYNRLECHQYCRPLSTCT